MHVIRVRNVHEALPAGIKYLAGYGTASPSRVGNVIVAPGPVTTVLDRPTERVLTYPERDANPFFHFMEGLGFLAGRKDLAYYSQFVKRMEAYSDDGETLPASYGWRWRNHFGFDQLTRAIALFRNHPNTRRAVVAMWDPATDLHDNEAATKDAPCNTSVMFWTSLGRRDEPNRLNMTVVNRSNDIIMGLYGANAVHMSMLLEYMATNIGLVVGSMTTVSNNFHIYQQDYDKFATGALAVKAEPTASLYEKEEVEVYPLIQKASTWDADLAAFMVDPAHKKFDNEFFREVAAPMWWAHSAHKRGAYTQALEIIATCRASDWRIACTQWLQRRQTTWQQKKRIELGREQVDREEV